jgi:hypothetical protein
MEEMATPRGRIPFALDETRAPNARARVVVEIVARAIAGESIRSIARALNARMEPSPTERARAWSPASVRAVASARAYVPEIVSERDHARALEALETRARACLEPRTLLSNLASAPCGGKLKASARARYRCARDGCVSIDIERADRAVRASVSARVRSDEWSARSLTDQRAFLRARARSITLGSARAGLSTRARFARSVWEDGEEWGER